MTSFVSSFYCYCILFIFTYTNYMMYIHTYIQCVFVGGFDSPWGSGLVKKYFNLGRLYFGIFLVCSSTPRSHTYSLGRQFVLWPRTTSQSVWDIKSHGSTWCLQQQGCFVDPASIITKNWSTFFDFFWSSKWCFTTLGTIIRIF